MSALASFLWDTNADVLRSYLARVPATVYAPRVTAATAFANPVALDGLLDVPARRAVEEEATARANAIRGALEEDDFADAPVDAATTRRAVGAELDERLRTAMALIAALDAAHTRTPLHLVLLNEDVTLSGRTAAEWARANGVRSAVVSHSCLLGRAYTVHGAVHADEIFVFGERGAASYRDAGIDPARLVLASNPAWDRLRSFVARKPEVRAQLRAELSWGESDSVVVFGTTWAANLSAFGEAEIEATSADAFFAAMASVRAAHPNVRILVKGRRGDAEQALLAAAAVRHGVSDWAYATLGTERVVVAADVLVSVNSNLSIEAAIAGVPAVNVWTPMSWTLGPQFGATDGVVDAVPEHLGRAVTALLGDPALAERVRALAASRLAAVGGRPDGTAADRIAERLADRARRDGVGPRYVWQELSAPLKAGVKANDGTYNTNVRRELFPLLAQPPRVVLEIGCATGGTAAALRSEHGAFAVGVERDPETAAQARTRLDAVVEGDVADLAPIRAALRGRAVDTLILADVLEHLYDPWATLVSLHDLLSPDAQVLASIPNARNLWLMNELAAGRWSYDYDGLLDVTHIRFFTLAEIRRMFAETGYRIDAIARNADGRTGAPDLTFTGARDIRAGNITLHGVTAQDLTELTSLQFLVRARRAD